MNKHCKDCPFKAKDYKQVRSAGNPNADIVIIGRNPGAMEAKQGKLFTGPSGQLLDATLAEIGLKRKDLFITTAVSCHLPKDKPPVEGMYKACFPRLEEEIAVIKPKLIITLGADSTGVVLDIPEKLTTIAGSLVYSEKLDNWILSTFDPSYILRGNTAAFDNLYFSLKKAKKIVEGSLALPVSLPKEKIIYYRNCAEVYKGLNKLIDQVEVLEHIYLSLDTEAEKTHFHRRELVLVQISDGKYSYVFEADQMLLGVNKVLARYLFSSDKVTWIMHNAAYDLQQINHHFKVTPTHIEDTMMLGLCLDERLNQVGLKKLSRDYLNIPHYEETIAQYMKNDKYSIHDMPKDDLVLYAGYDALFTYQLYKVLLSLVKEEGNLHLYTDLLLPSQIVFAEISYRGVLIDQSYIEELRNEYYPIRDQLETDMQALAKERGFHPSEAVKAAKEGDQLNVNSPKQLKHFINKYLFIPTGTTNQAFIDKYADRDEFVKMLQKSRKINKMISSYVDGIAKNIWPDSKVHPDFLHGTVSGRLTIKNPALQTLPRNDVAESEFQSIKKLFIPTPGYTFVHADYSQLEVRVAWDITQDEALGEAVLTSDFHREVAASVFHKAVEDIIEEERQDAKAVTFGLMYNRQAWSLSQSLGCTEAEAQEYIDTFFTRFWKYGEWFHKTQAQALDTGILTTSFGRRRRWRLITDTNVHFIKNEAVNFPVQSTATDINLYSLIAIHYLLKEKQLGYILFTVHDSIEFEIKTNRLEEGIALIKDTMENPLRGLRETCATFAVDIECGQNMGETKKWLE